MKEYGIPTTYAGVRFRSRLEATWACMADLWGYEWQYEPFDLEGYIPDFVIRSKGQAERGLLMEVKPTLNPQDLWEFAPKIDQSGWSGEALIVGGAMPLCLPWAWMGLRRHAGRKIWGLDTDPFESRGPERTAALSEMWAEAKNWVQWKGRR